MIFKISLFFLIISLMIDPTGDFFNFKYISVGLSFLVFWIYFIINRSNFTLNYIQIIIFSTFSILMPVYGLLVTYFNTSLSKINDTSYLGFSVFLLMLFPVTFMQPKIFLRIVILALRVLSFITIIILISFVYDADSIGIAQFFIDKKSMLVGFREYAGIQTYFLYFTASPLLILLVAYDSYKLVKKITIGNVLLSILSITAIFLTGTRFNMLMAIVILPTIIIVYKFSIKRIPLYLFLIFCFFILLFQSSFINSFFSLNDDSNSVKIGYFDSYSGIFKQPEVLILGQGFSGYDSSILFRSMLDKFGNEGVKTELTCVELFRVFGLFFGSVFNIVIMSIPFFLYNKFKEINFLIIGIVFYLISSLINPYIFSTNGVIIFLLIIVLLQNSNNNSLTTKKDFLYD